MKIKITIRNIFKPKDIMSSRFFTIIPTIQLVEDFRGITCKIYSKIYIYFSWLCWSLILWKE